MHDGTVHFNSISSPQPIDVLYTLGPGHCGSTLLNLSLDRHSQVIGVSEIVSLNRNRKGWAGDENVFELPFWQAVSARLHEDSGLSLWDVPFNLTPGSGAEDLSANNAALRAISSVSNKPVIADASKSPERLNALLKSPLFRVWVVYLVRDGRAVINAYQRKYRRWWIGYRKLMRIERSAKKMRMKFSGTPWKVLRYEDFAGDIEGSLRGLCEFAELSFEEEMLTPDASMYQGLGGNRMRKKPVEKIERDDAWKQEMGYVSFFFSGLAVSSFNARNGY